MKNPRVDVTSVNQEELGHWRLFVNAHSGPGREITSFRSIPVQPSTMSFADPFGPKSMSFKLPQVTYWEQLGINDLEWLHPWSTVVLRWHPKAGHDLPLTYPHGKIQTISDPAQWWHLRKGGFSPSFSWYGRMSGFNWGEDGLAVDCQGMYYSLDDYLAKPEYPFQPLPYEWAIARHFIGHPNLRMKPLTVVWPDWWTEKYVRPPKGTKRYLIPAHVHPGRFWTGLVTRQTGSWDPVGTSYIQTLLTSMYTRRGRWTIDLFDGMRPVLLHRDIQHVESAEHVVIDLAGTNTLAMSEDWTQSLNVAYAQGTSLAGEQFTGMNVAPDGSQTRYEPMASLRQVHPETHRHNPWFQSYRTRREVMLQMQQGIDELQAHDVAGAHLEMFSEPGLTGTITLSEDPLMNGQRISRMLIRAGMTCQLTNIRGTSRGVFAHITENEVNFEEETNTLTFDTKYRDALTVREVRLRGRNSLSIPRMLQVGQWQPPVPDMLVPWSYSEGSGCVPRHANRAFSEMPDDEQFPWQNWTRAHPPSKSRWEPCYAKIGPASTNANDNWAWVGHGRADGHAKIGNRFGLPVYLAQAGDIRLFQIAAYDRNGNVLPVRFHVSIYNQRGVNVLSMPMIPAYQPDSKKSDYYPYHPPAPYLAHQRYPFVKDGWNQYTASGTQTNPNIPHPTSSAGLIRGWGDYYEPAGYWPGSKGAKNPKTGLLVSEDIWHFDTVQNPNTFDPYKHRQPPWAGLFYVMIYCDDQGNQPVYFMGRMFRVEPGTQTG